MARPDARGPRRPGRAPGICSDASDRPARPIRPPVDSIREDLGRGHRLVTLAERTILLRRRILRIPEGDRTLGPSRGEHDPGGRGVVLPDFRHGTPYEGKHP